jgi:hypothetical protein
MIAHLAIINVDVADYRLVPERMLNISENYGEISVWNATSMSRMVDLNRAARSSSNSSDLSSI